MAAGQSPYRYGVPCRGVTGRIAALTILLQAVAGLPALASLQVAPAVVEAELAQGGRAGPVWVRNLSSGTAEAWVELVGLTHEPNGRPVFLDDPPSKATVAAVLRPSWERMSLGPGASAPLYFEVRPGPLPAALYAAAFIHTPVPTGTVRVSVLLLLSQPGAARPAGQGQPESWPPSCRVPPQADAEEAPVRVEAAWAEQERAGDPVQLVARVANRGPVHVRPRVMALICDRTGAVVGRALLVPAVVFPGAVRELRGAWAPALLPPGSYPMAVGPAGTPGQGWWESLLVVNGPYRLARVKGRMALLLGEKDAGRHVQAVLRNEGELALQGWLEVVVAAPGVPELRQRLDCPALQPGQQAVVALPGPTAGDAAGAHWRVRWVAHGQVVAEASASAPLPAVSAAMRGLGRP